MLHSLLFIFCPHVGQFLGFSSYVNSCFKLDTQNLSSISYVLSQLPPPSSLTKTCHFFLQKFSLPSLSLHWMPLAPPSETPPSFMWTSAKLWSLCPSLLLHNAAQGILKYRSDHVISLFQRKVKKKMQSMFSFCPQGNVPVPSCGLAKLP